MLRSIHRVMVVLASLVLLSTGCNKEQPRPDTQTEGQAMSRGSTDNAEAGVTWSVPERWLAHPPGPMRVATYIVPAVVEGDESGECAVFYFGKEQGGDVTSNIDRWVGQFEDPRSETSSRSVGGMKVYLVRISGTYLAPGGPMMQSQGKKENYSLLGAIVEAPGGLVFFKFTGPAKTIASAEEEFNGLVSSLSKG